MNLKILLPSRIFVEKTEVTRIVAESTEGFFGLLPQRLDCVAALVPGILCYESKDLGEIFLAIDQGVLVKTGTEVLISVRNAIRGDNLTQLRQAVDKEFLNLNTRELNVRSVMAKMESSLIQRLAELHHD